MEMKRIASCLVACMMAIVCTTEMYADLQIGSAMWQDPKTIYKAVEQMPEFPGGMPALTEWLSGNIHYPEMAMMNDIQGKVIVEFIVEKDGSIGEAKILKSVDSELDNEALRVVKSMPRWQPAMNEGVPVRCYFTLPITFKLQTEAEANSQDL